MLLLVQRDGTNSSHFLLFEEETAYVLNRLGLNNIYIIVDNVRIPTSTIFAPLLPNVKSNWIEKWRSKIKSEMRNEKLPRLDPLLCRIQALYISKWI